EDGIRDGYVSGVQSCALPIYADVLAPRTNLSLISAVVLLAGHLGSNERQFGARREHVGVVGPHLVDGGDERRGVVGPGEGAEEEIGRASCRDRVLSGVGEGKM